MTPPPRRRARAAVTVPSLLLVAALGAAVLPGSAQAAPLPKAAATTTKTVVVTPSDDTYLDSAWPNRAPGAATKVVAGVDSRTTKAALLRFVVPAAPADATLTGAQLQLTANRGLPAKVELRSLSSTSWVEDTVSFSSGVKTTTLRGTASPATGSRSLAYDVKSLTSPGKVLGLGLTSPSGTADLASKEAGAAGPRLVLTYTVAAKAPAPAPAPKPPAPAPTPPAPAPTTAPAPAPTTAPAPAPTTAPAPAPAPTTAPAPAPAPTTAPAPAPAPTTAPAPAPAPTTAPAPAPAPTTAPAPAPAPTTAPAPAPAPTTAPAPAPAPRKAARIGMSVPAAEWDVRVTETGGVDSRRVFDDLDSPDFAVTTATSEAAVGRMAILSFKIPGNDWAGVGAGAYDAQLRALAARLDAVDGPVFVTLHHEPTGDGSPTDYAAMMRRALPILGAPENVDAGPIVNGFWFSARSQGYTDAEIAQWLPADVLAVSEVVASDTYQGGTPTNPGEDAGVKIRRMSDWANRVGVDRLGIGEYNGVDAASVTAAGDAILADPRYEFAAIFNSSKNNREGINWVLTGDRLSAFKATVDRARQQRAGL